MDAVAVVPAAGRSRRMGYPKWRLPYREGTVLGAVLEALRQGGAKTVAVVAAPDDPQLCGWLQGEAVVTAVNPEPSRGMLSSILVGLEALGGAASLAASGTALLVCPCDLPALAADTVRRVLRAHLAAERLLVVPTYRDQRGHPLAISPQLVPGITTLDPEVGLRQLLDLHPEAVLELPVDDPGCVRDVDTPEELRRLLEA